MKKRKLFIAALSCSMLVGCFLGLTSCGGEQEKEDTTKTETFYRISYTSSSDYEIEGLERQYKAGDKVSFSIKLKNEEKKIVSVYANSEVLKGVNDVYSFKMPEEHVAIIVTLEDAGEEIDDTLQQFSVNNYVAKVSKQGTFRFEAEKTDVTNYYNSSDNSSKIVERADASEGKFLAAATGDIAKNGYFEFKLDCDFAIEFTMSVAYAQTNKRKANDQDLTKSYTYIIDENKNVALTKDTILKSREDITKWDVKEYDKQTLTKGVHTFKVNIAENTGKGNPNVDYMDFKIRKIADYEEGDNSLVPANDFHTELQYNYIHDSNVESIEKYAKGTQELSKPRGLKLDFSKDNLDASSSYVVQIADDNAFTKNVKLFENITNTYYEVYNLMLGQKVFWRASTTKTNFGSSPIHELTVATEGPRNLNIDGISNFRDIGGYDSSLITKGKIKQGLYFRGANPNNVTSAGKKTVHDDLGIRVEIDMRDSDQCKGPYIDGVTYYAKSIPSGTESTRFEGFASVYKDIFTLIYNADNAPIYLHCTAGADRTGISTFILLTLCGANYDDIARDYLFTNFSTQGSRFSNFTSEFKQWWSKLDNFEGTTKADKAEQWLISKGLTVAQCEHIREIFVPGYEAKA